MQEKKIARLSLWISISLLTQLFACAGLTPGPEGGVHGGLLSQGIHGAYQGSEGMGVETGWHQSTSWPRSTDFYGNNSSYGHMFYGSVRKYFGNVFLIKLGASYTRFESINEYRYDDRSARLHGETLGIQMGLGNLWHLRNGIVFGCDYISANLPVLILSRKIETQGGRLTAQAESRSEGRMREPTVGILTLYVGYSLGSAAEVESKRTK